MDEKALLELVQWIAEHDTSGKFNEEIVKLFMIEKIQNSNLSEVYYPNIKTDLISRVKNTQLI